MRLCGLREEELRWSHTPGTKSCGGGEQALCIGLQIQEIVWIRLLFFFFFSSRPERERKGGEHGCFLLFGVSRATVIRVFFSSFISQVVGAYACQVEQQPFNITAPGSGQAGGSKVQFLYTWRAYRARKRRRMLNARKDQEQRARNGKHSTEGVRSGWEGREGGGVIIFGCFVFVFEILLSKHFHPRCIYWLRSCQIFIIQRY